MMYNNTARTILDQLGARKFIAMTGAKELTACGKKLSFKIERNATSINYVTIELDEARDAYNMSFERVTLSRKTWDVTRKTIVKKEGVYCDMLRDIFTDVTGLATSL